MCMTDDAEQVRHLDRGGFVTARQEHRCMECARQIDAGEKYHAETFVLNGAVTRHKTCGHCMAVRQWLADECGGWAYTAVEEDAAEHVSGYGMDLARAVIGMRWKWRGKSGRLLPVPRRILTGHELKRKREVQP